MTATKLQMWRGILVALLLFSPLSDAAESLKDKALEESEETLSTSIRENPGSISLLSRRGDVRLFLGRYSEAVEDFEKMISLDPLQDAPHWRLGIAYYFAGDFRKSARQFEKYHAYDGRDRENGVWKFMAQTCSESLETARAQMLQYPPMDREPFLELYDMFAGKKTVSEVIKQYGPKPTGGNKTVQFFAKYYAGVYTALTGKKADGLKQVKEAVGLFSPDSASEPGAPGYMWQVARLHVKVIESDTSSPRGK